MKDDEIHQIDGKKESFSLRIDPNLFHVLKELAAAKNLSINQLINKILETSTYWNEHAPLASWLPMPKPILLELIDKFSDKEIEALSNKLGRQIAKDILLFTDAKYDVDSLLHFLKVRAEVSGFQFSIHAKGSVLHCVLHHSMGKKWSVWFKNFYETVLLDMKRDVKFETSENTLTMEIRNI